MTLWLLQVTEVCAMTITSTELPRTTEDPGTPLPIRSLLHPYERSRFILALIAAIALSPFWVVMGVVLVLPWIGLQIYRKSALLGNAVRVTGDSLPSVQQELDLVRARLSFDKPVDVYVAENSSALVTLTSYLGTHILLLDGDLMADLTDGKEPQLRFLLGSFLGSLKAKHQRLTPALVAIRSVKSLQVVNPLVNPYLRATRYSGDQIGYACSGDLASTLEMMYRLLVGKDLAPALPRAAVFPQAAELQEGPLPRIHQWFSSDPHWVNRYINVLAFAEQANPVEFARFRADLEPSADQLLETMLARSPHRRTPPS